MSTTSKSIRSAHKSGLPKVPPRITTALGITTNRAERDAAKADRARAMTLLGPLKAFARGRVDDGCDWFRNKR